MRIPKIDVWGAAGDPEDGTGFVTYHRVPVHLWLLDAWLAVGHPHWGWWYRLWGRILPDWGDPFCAAYTAAWWRFYSRQAEGQATVETGWAGLPPAIKERILAGRAKDREQPGPLPGEI